MPKVKAPVDSRGRKIKVGARVAYNRSGQVVEGRVDKVNKKSVKIIPHPDFYRPWNTPFSTILNYEGILVLDEPVESSHEAPAI